MTAERELQLVRSLTCGGVSKLCVDVALLLMVPSTHYILRYFHENKILSGHLMFEHSVLQTPT